MASYIRRISPGVFCAFLALLLAGPASAADRPGTGNRYALLVGVNQYADLNPLRFAVADVSDMYRVLTEHAGYREDHVVLMTQARAAENLRFVPEAKKIRTELDLLLRLCDKGDTILVALAGHGVQLQGDKEHYYCPADADLKDKTALIGLGEVYRRLETCKADVKLLFVDACRNDPRSANSRARLEVELESVTRPVVPEPPGGVAAFFSCSAGERAFEHEDLKHGVFFHFLLEGLKGGAADREGQVELPDLEKYVKREVKAFVLNKYRRTQIPEMRNQTRDLVNLLDEAAQATRKGDELIRQRQYAKAEQLFSRLIKSGKGNALIYANRAVARGHLNNFNDATRDVEDAITMAPQSAAVWTARARVKRVMKDFNGAIADANRAIELDPQFAMAHKTLADAHRQNKDYDRAIGEYNRAIDLGPKYAPAYGDRGYAFEMKNNLDRAIADYTKAIELDSKYVYAYHNRGVSHGKKNELDRAIADFSKAIELDPKNARAHNDRGVAYAGKNDLDRAIADYSRAIELDPKDAKAHYNRGLTYAKKNELDRAIADFSKAIELDPKNAGAHYDRGNVYAKKNDLDRAIADYSKAIELDPKYATAHNNRGQAYAKKNGLDRAIADFSMAIELNPKYKLAHENRAKTYRKLGDTAKAEADEAKAKELEGKK